MNRGIMEEHEKTATMPAPTQHTIAG